MRLSRRTNTIILWVISIGLLVGMIITFTPTLGNLNLFGGSPSGSQGATALLVNGQSISQLAVTQLQQQNHSLSAIQEGEMGDDIELLVLDSLIRNEVLRQAAAGVRVSGGDVRQALSDFRESQGVAGSRNDDAYLRLVNNLGYTDQTFRDALREQLQLQRYQDGIIEAVTVSDAEIEALYTLNQENYRSEERVRARMIVVDDQALAEDLREQALADADFAELASANSLERADRGGALGAAAGSSEPLPVGRAALPTAVAAATFELEEGGLTEVVEVAGRFYLVSVEAFEPAAVQPLAEVRSEVEADALAAKQQQVLEVETERLFLAAEITVPEESLSRYQDPVVAQVGDRDIRASELVRATYTNPQIQQALSPQNASLITQFFKPSFLANLIDQELAYQGAQQLDVDFLGPRGLIAQNALAYVSRDAAASDDEIEAFYQDNLARFTVPPSADVTQVTFEDAEDAGLFREALLAGIELVVAADASNGTLEEIGVVGPGVLDPDLDAALFATDGFEPLSDGDLEVSDVLVLTDIVEAEPADEATAAEEDGGEEAATEEGAAPEEEGSEEAAPEEEGSEEAAPEEDSSEAVGAEEDGGDEAAAEGDADETAVPEGEDGDLAEPAEVVEEPLVTQQFVILVAARTAERVRSLEEVREQVETSVLAAERTELRSDWLAGLREEISVENLLNPALDEALDVEPGADTEDVAPEETDESSDAAPDEPEGEAPAGDEEVPAGDEEAPAGDEEAPEGDDAGN